MTDDTTDDTTAGRVAHDPYRGHRLDVSGGRQQAAAAEPVEVTDSAEVTTESEPSGPGPSGTVVDGEHVASPAGDARSTPTADDVPDGAADVVGWIADAVGDERVARAEAAWEAESARDGDPRKTVQAAVARVVDDVEPPD